MTNSDRLDFIPGTKTPIHYTSAGYPIFAFGATMLILSASPEDGSPTFLNITRGGEPYKGWIDLPAGHVEPTETALEGAIRETLEEVNLIIDPSEAYLSHESSTPGRDPNKPCPLVVFYHFMPEPKETYPSDDAASVQWTSLDEYTAIDFAFDTNDVMYKAVNNIALNTYNDIVTVVDTYKNLDSDKIVNFIYHLFQLSNSSKLNNVTREQIDKKVSLYLAEGEIPWV